MPTIFTHPAIALTGTCFPRMPRVVYALGAIATILPDCDVIAFKLGIPYESTFGHRGFSHSILFAFLVALLFTFLARTTSRLTTFAFLFLCAISHPLLDALTNGGLGVALFSPWSNVRYFAPWRPIRVSAIGPRFFSARGLATLASELVWVWIPCVAIALLGKYLAHRKREVRQQR